MWSSKECHLKVRTGGHEAQPILKRVHAGIVQDSSSPVWPVSAPSPFPIQIQTVDRFNNLLVTAFATPGNARFLLLHDGRNDDSIKSFFTEVYELYVRVSQG